MREFYFIQTGMLTRLLPSHSRAFSSRVAPITPMVDQTWLIGNGSLGLKWVNQEVLSLSVRRGGNCSCIISIYWDLDFRCLLHIFGRSLNHVKSWYDFYRN